jgi:integrase/recombinase XerC
LVIIFFMPINQLFFIQSFLDYLKFQKRYSQHTIISYQNDLISFFDFTEIQFSVQSLNEINASFARSWLASLKEKGIESKSINRKISTLKSFFKYQLKKGIILTSPMATIVSTKVKKGCLNLLQKTTSVLCSIIWSFRITGMEKLIG